MPMPPIEFYVSMFRDERDQARSQYVLLFLMEALCRVNQSLLRHAEALKKNGLGELLPRLYRSGVHYEREPPGQEHWPDITKILALFDGPGQFPGPWGDCEDLACWRVGELREAPAHFEGGKKVGGGVKAKPFAKWRRGSEGQFNYHALVLLPDGKIEDPSLTLGMRKEAEFARNDTANKLKRGEIQPTIQYAEPPDVMVVDPDSPSGYATRVDRAGLVGAKRTIPLEEAHAKVMEGSLKSYGMEIDGCYGQVLGEIEELYEDEEEQLLPSPSEAPAWAPPSVPVTRGPVTAPGGRVIIPEITEEKLRSLAAKVRDPVGTAKSSVKTEAQRILQSLLRRTLS